MANGTPQPFCPSITIVADPRSCNEQNPNGIKLSTNLPPEHHKFGVCQLLADSISQWTIWQMNQEKSGVKMSTMVLPNGMPIPLKDELAEKLADRQTQLPPTE